MKQLLARVCSFLARSTQELSMEFLKIIVPMLVNGTKEKNTFVKANCEFALIAVLRLREGDVVHQVRCTLSLTTFLKRAASLHLPEYLDRIIIVLFYVAGVYESTGCGS